MIVPILLMALGSVAAFPSGADGTLVEGFAGDALAFVGTPVAALLIGVLLALALLPERRDEETLTRLRFTRQALHAARLGFVHPVNSSDLAFDSAMPADMQELFSVLDV